MGSFREIVHKSRKENKEFSREDTYQKHQIQMMKEEILRLKDINRGLEAQIATLYKKLKEKEQDLLMKDRLVDERAKEVAKTFGELIEVREEMHNTLSILKKENYALRNIIDEKEKIQTYVDKQKKQFIKSKSLMANVAESLKSLNTTLKKMDSINIYSSSQNIEELFSSLKAQNRYNAKKSEEILYNFSSYIESLSDGLIKEDNSSNNIEPTIDYKSSSKYKTNINPVEQEDRKVDTCFPETVQKNKKEPIGYFDISESYLRGTVPFISSLELDNRDKRLENLETKVENLGSKVDSLERKLDKILNMLSNNNNQPEENYKEFKTDILHTMKDIK